MDDYKKYLAEQVISEDRIVTYRTLSRALKINVNIAKQMLYDFHSWQNGKKTGAVHATYMIYGTKRNAHANGHSQHDADVEMTSSPPESAPQAEGVPLVTLSLVAEESLSDVLAQYEQVTSLHVYSLGPHPVKDMQLLADVSRPILDVVEDESVTLRPVRNPYVRRRERRSAASKAVPAPEPVRTKPAPANPAPAPAAKVKEPKIESKPSSKESTPVPSGTQKPAPKRGASGGIMQSFAKAAAMPKKASTPKTSTPSASVDADIQGLALSDDGEDDSVTVPEPKSEANQGNEATRKSRNARKDELERMMEESSEDEEPEKEDIPMEEAEEPPAPEEETKEDAEPAEVVSSTGDGRRRGKRQVMKKKTVMDEQGYLVTVQEKGWESFSEDEPVLPSKRKAEVASQPAKPKKAAPKGQGNIMSFFGKK
ncbi:unnamed protein product [Discula destructiva]